ncbi:MAG: hypothetical protein WA874_02840 [Chryseosolibacter sp.]
MDIIDNVMFANLFGRLQNGNTITSEFVPAFAPAVPLSIVPGAGNYSFDNADKWDYSAFQDPMVIEKSILRHWHDVNARANYDHVAAAPGYQVRPNGTALAGGDVRYASFLTMRNYHLMFAYLVENTRILQIFERLIDRYTSDETFGVAIDPLVFNWLQNSEKLFFRNESPTTLITSAIRPSTDAARRNAYWRMFGMDLSFGDINSIGNSAYSYTKAKAANQQFVIIFERYLAEVWQGYINARNSSGVNSTDINNMINLADQIRELLTARRGNVNGNSYAYLNLSREEFASVLINSWFTFVISDDTPLVQFLNCQSSTIGERLLKIGAKVGIPAHSRSQSLFEMAGPAANVLSLIEAGGTLDNQGTMQNILTSLNPPFVPSLNSNYMEDFLSIINNWERATGHRIKNPETKLSAVVKVSENGHKPQPRVPVPAQRMPAPQTTLN